jgi:predicted CopG family antitoxin
MNEKIKNMRTINISISDMEYNHLGIKNENITFSEFTELVKREVMRNNLNNCVALSSMTMNEINEEIKSVRNAKNRH